MLSALVLVLGNFFPLNNHISIICMEFSTVIEFCLKCDVNCSLVMDNRGEDEHEEELDFHLGTASDDENMLLNSSLSSMGKDVGGDAQRDAPVNYPYGFLFISSVLWVCGS